MKIFNIVLITLVGLVFIGCGDPQPPKPTIVYKTKIVYKSLPCKVPEVKCDFSGKGFDPTVKLLECVILQKHVLDSLRENNTSEATR